MAESAEIAEGPEPAEGSEPAAMASLERERSQLMGLSYRLLGTVADAEDAVQETYARWYRLAEAERDAIGNPGPGSRASRAGCASTCSAPPAPVVSATSASGCPSPCPGPPRSRHPSRSTRSSGSASTTPCRPRCWWCSSRSRPPSGSRSCCTTSSGFRSPRSPRRSGAVRMPAPARLAGAAPRPRAPRGRGLPRDARRRRAGVRRGEGDGRSRVAGRGARSGRRAARRRRRAGLGRPPAGDRRGPRRALPPRRPAARPGAQIAPALTPDGLGFFVTLDGAAHSVITLGVRDGRIADVWIMRNPEKLTLWG